MWGLIVPVRKLIIIHFRKDQLYENLWLNKN